MVHAPFLRPFVLALFFVVGLPSPVQAQVASPQDQPIKETDLNLPSLLSRLVTSHDRILAAAARAESAQQQYRRAWSGWYPRLGVFADGGYEYIDRPDDGELDVDVDESSKLKNMQSLRLTQLLYDFGRTGGAIGGSLARYEQAGQSLEAIRQEVLLAGIRAYVDVLRAFRVLGFAMRSEQNIKQQTGIEEALVQRGAGLSSDVLQAKSQLSAALVRRIAGEGDLANALSYFKAIYMLEPTSEMIQRFVMPEIPTAALPQSVDKAVAVALERNPRVLASMKNIEAVEGDVDVARSRFFPVIDLASDATRRENELSVSGVRTEARALVELRYDFYSGGADKAALESAKAERLGARRSLDDLKRQVEQQARIAWSNYQTSIQRAEYLSVQVDILHEFLDLARKERRLGKRSLLDVLSGEVDYINAQSNLAAAKAETVKAAYELLYAMGRLNPEAASPRKG